MKIYTRTGDGGETSLFGGERVPKDADRIEAYGTVDELNALIGAVMAFCEDETLSSLLRELQNDLFVVGADLASPVDSQSKKIVRIGQNDIERLEKLIDMHEEELEPLSYFILPGGTIAASLLHTARTVCRRAERRVVHLGRSEKINEFVLVFLNRLSDLLFVLARVANSRKGVKDVPWKGTAGK